MPGDFLAPDARFGDEDAAVVYNPANGDHGPDEAALLELPGVVGIGHTVDADGAPEIVVYLASVGYEDRIPPTVNGKRVQIAVTGPIRAL